MQIITSTSQLYNCLETVEKALPFRSTVPTINNILLEADNNVLKFYSTNLEMAISVKMDYKSNNAGKILIPPKIIDIIRYFPVPEVNIIINLDNYQIDISGGSAHFKLNGSDAQDYPVANFGQINKDNSYNIEERTFKKLLKAVIFAASTEETRPAFNGIYFSFYDNKMRLTASDTYRLVIKEIVNDGWSFQDKSCLVPARVIRELLRIISDSEQDVFLGIDNKAIAIFFEETKFISRLLEEKYPDVSGVIPKEYKTRVVINRKSLEDAINRASLLAEGKNQAVNLVLANNQLETKVSSQEGHMEEVIPVEQDGEDINLHVNTRFILDILKILDDDEMILDFHGNEGPLIFRLIDDQTYLYLVLPIKRIN